VVHRDARIPGVRRVRRILLGDLRVRTMVHRGADKSDDYRVARRRAPRKQAQVAVDSDAELDRAGE